MKVAVLYSGGKDSTYGLYRAMEKEDVVCLISIVSKNKDSFMFHTPNIEITRLQAPALGLPLIQKITEGKKEEELNDLKDAIKTAKDRFRIEGVVTGAVASVYQKERIQKVCEELNLKCLNPLWKKDPEELMRDIIKDGFKFILSSVAALGLDESWLGRVITDEDINKLAELNKRIGLHIAFEGGEAETLMIDGPIFKKKISIKKAEKIMENEHTGIYKIINAELQ